MRASRRLILVVGMMVVFVLGAGTGAAQSRRPKPTPTPAVPAPTREELTKLAAEASAARANLISKTGILRQSLEKVLELQRADEKRLSELVEQQRSLLAEGIVSRIELEKAEQALAEASKLAASTAVQIEGADQLVTEVEAAEELAKAKPEPVDAGVVRSSLKLIRYTGTTKFSLIDHLRIDEYFRGQFGRSMPISALGQTGVHDRLGFDHRGALDVALHPDSPEGQALMTYLRSQGIPYLAFRGAIAGSATGAHIHIGQPSHRILQ